MGPHELPASGRKSCLHFSPSLPEAPESPSEGVACMVAEDPPRLPHTLPPQRVSGCGPGLAVLRLRQALHPLLGQLLGGEPLRVTSCLVAPGLRGECVLVPPPALR